MKEYNPGDLIEFHERSGKEIGIVIRVVRDSIFNDFGAHIRFPDDDMSYHYYFNELSVWETDGGITVHRG